MNDSYGLRVRLWRTRQNVTATRLAQALGISRQALWAIETDRATPSHDTRIKLDAVMRLPEAA